MALSSPADEIKLTGAKWDDVATALSIKPFYLEVKSETAAKSIKLVLDVYQGGKLVQQYASGGLGQQEPSPIDLKSALFFAPKDNAAEYSVTWTMDTGRGTGTSRFIVPKAVVDLSGTAMASVTPKISDSNRSLLGTIICNSKAGYTMGDDLESTLAANKTATVIGIFLERE